MAQTKFGVAVSPHVAEELDDLVEDCADLRASRSEVVEAILMAYLQTDADRTKKTRQLVIENRTRSR